MSIQRKSVFSSIARPSAVTIYSTTLYSNDEDDHRRLPRYYSAIYSHKADVYRVLERQQGRHTLIYHLFVFCLTLISLVFGSISTIDKWRSTLNKPLYYGELGLCIFFTYEFLLRIWSAGCLAKYRTWIGRLMFMTRSVIVLDILTLLGFALSISTGITTGEFPEIILKFLPLLQMIRFIRVDRQLTSWKILKGIILKHHQELTVTIVIGFMFLITGAYLVYIAETSVDPKLNTGSYKSMADSIWFSIITMTTIGFGDIFPKTYIGKIVTTTICYVGVAFWCLPVGIIGSGLAIKVQEQKRDDAFNRLIPAAASVIRNWWRLQCVYQGDRFVATWKIYTLMRRRVHVPVPSLTQDLSSTLTLMRSLSSNPYGTKSFPFNQANTTTIPKLNNVRRKSITSIEDLPKGYLTAIKIIRILKYSSSCKKFHQAKKPINLKDVVNENTQLNNRLSIILNDIQRRLDLALGTKKLASYLTDEQKRQLSLSSRIEKVEQITNQFETKLNYLERLALTLIEKQLK